MDSPVLDVFDRAIVDELRADGRCSWRELADRIGLGASATTERVRRLEASGVIRSYHATIDPGALGIELSALVDIRLRVDADHDEFEARLAETHEVQGAVHLTGPFDYQVTVACPDVTTLDRLLRGWEEIAESNTRLILSEVDLATRR